MSYCQASSFVLPVKVVYKDKEFYKAQPFIPISESNPFNNWKTVMSKVEFMTIPNNKRFI